MYQGVLVLSKPYTAPLLLRLVGSTVKDLVANTSGWPWLSVRLMFTHHAQSPLLLPSEALAWVAKLVSWVLYKSKFCCETTIFACPSNCFGIRVT